MSKQGQWSCEPCAAAHGYAWGVGQYSAQRGWCGVGSHRTDTRLEFVEGADCQRPIVTSIRAAELEPCRSESTQGQSSQADEPGRWAGVQVGGAEGAQASTPSRGGNTPASLSVEREPADAEPAPAPNPAGQMELF